MNNDFNERQLEYKGNKIICKIHKSINLKNQKIKEYLENKWFWFEFLLFENVDEKDKNVYLIYLGNLVKKKINEEAYNKIKASGKEISRGSTTLGMKRAQYSTIIYQKENENLQKHHYLYQLD